MLLQKVAADFVAGHIGVSDSLVKDMVFSQTFMTYKESPQVYTHGLSQDISSWSEHALKVSTCPHVVVPNLQVRQHSFFPIFLLLSPIK